MAGYDPKRPRPSEGPRLVGLPGDPIEPVDVAATAPAVDADPAPGPTRRALPRAAPPLDRRLPPAAFAGAAGGLVVLILLWRRIQRR